MCLLGSPKLDYLIANFIYFSSRMNGMWTRYQKLVEQYTIGKENVLIDLQATRLEMNQKYGIAVTAYYNFVCTGLLFAEEYRSMC